MQKAKTLPAMAATVAIVAASLAPTQAFALSSSVRTANQNFVSCLVTAFQQQAGQRRVTQRSLSGACTRYERAYYNAVYNEKPGIKNSYKRNNANAAVSRLKSKVFRTFGI